MSVTVSKRTRNQGPPPQRRKRKRSLMKRVVPAFIMLVIMSGVVLVGSIVVAKVLRPFKLCNIETREERRLASEYLSLKKENADLRRQLQYMNTPRGVAGAARKLGYVKPGEISLVIPEDNHHPSKSTD